MSDAIGAIGAGDATGANVASNVKWLQGGGQTGELVRAFSWPESPAGCSSKWPQALRDAINTVLNAPLPMLLEWHAPQPSPADGSAATEQAPLLIYNDEYARLFGLPHAASATALQSRWHEIRSQSDPAAGTTHEKYTDRALVVSRDDGPSELSFDLFCVPSHDEQGRLAGAMATFVDNSSRQSALRLASDSLHIAESRLSGLYDQALVCYSELDLQGRFIRVNDAMCRMLGWTQEQLLQRSFTEITHADDVAVNWSMFQRCIDDGKPFNLEKRYIKPDGTAFWVVSSISRVTDPQGQPKSMVGVSIDISDRRRVEDALRELNETLEQRVVEEIRERTRAEAALQQSQKMEAVGQLTGGVAHDFNNVLQIIAGNLQLLQPESTTPLARQRFEAAFSAVGRGAKLSSQLLAFARRQPLQPVSTNLGRIVRGMDDLLRRSIGEHIEIATLVDDDLWNTMVDPGQVENLVVNMAINARDAIKDRGRLTLELRNTVLRAGDLPAADDLEPGEYVCLTVTDTGEGMSPEVVARAFEPFFTTKPHGEATGLGLSMAYGFVKQSKGHIRIDSEVGKGTRIRIYFPSSEEKEVVAEENRHAPVVGGTESVLVVEDDVNLQLTVLDILRSLGYRVHKADNAEAALRLIEEGVQIDLLFTDVVMPGRISSTELARQAKQILPQLAVLFTSGYAQDVIVHEGRVDPGVELLSKPYRREQLARKLRHVLANQQQRNIAGALRAKMAESTAARADRAALIAAAEELNEQESSEQHIAEPQLEAPVAQLAQHPEAGAEVAEGLRILVVEDNIDAQQLVCELIDSLGHVAQGVSSAEEALKLLENDHSFTVLFTDVSLPGMSGVDLARQARGAQPQLKVIFASGYGANIAKNVDFPAFSLPKPYDLEQLQNALEKVS